MITNIYAPNSPNMSYFNKLATWFTQSNHFTHVVGGDFNLIMHNEEGRKHTIKTYQKDKNKVPFNHTSHLSNFTEATRLRDVWRLRFPLEREYTYYSYAHKSFSRIDYILVTDDLINSISSAKNTQVGNIRPCTRYDKNAH